MAATSGGGTGILVLSMSGLWARACAWTWTRAANMAKEGVEEIVWGVESVRECRVKGGCEVCDGEVHRVNLKRGVVQEVQVTRCNGSPLDDAGARSEASACVTYRSDWLPHQFLQARRQQRRVCSWTSYDSTFSSPRRGLVLCQARLIVSGHQRGRSRPSWYPELTERPSART